MDIDNINGKYQGYSLSQVANHVTYSQVNGITLKNWSGTWNYTGMVNKDNQPHGYGRAIHTGNLSFYDGQWKDGVPHGYSRRIYYGGDCYQYEY